MQRKLNIIIFIVWVALMLYAILAPSSSLPKSLSFFSFISFFDKFVHAIMFGVFTFLLFWLIYPKRTLYFSLTAVILISVLFASLTEIMQYLLGKYINRTLEFMDIIADIIGIILAIGLCVFIVVNSTKKNKKKISEN